MNNSRLALIIAIALFGSACTSEQDLGEHGAFGMGGSAGGGSPGDDDTAQKASGAGGEPESKPGQGLIGDNDSNPVDPDKEKPTPGTESIVIKNLNVALVNGLIRLTFALENRMNVDAAYCQIGTVSTSTHQATADFSSTSLTNAPDAFQENGWCRGFWTDQNPGHFCADRDLSLVCDETGYGLLANDSTGVLELRAHASHSIIAWEQPGTEYRLTLRFLMADAAVVEASATTTLK